MTVFADTYDTVSPAGGDNPTEGDDRIRETKAAIQERENVDHYWPLTGTEVSDVDTGEHRKVTLRVGSAPSAVANKGFVYAKDVAGKAELFYIDEDGNEVQITSGGKILSASLDSKDEDDMTSNSASHTATQQSIKAYIDAHHTFGTRTLLDTVTTTVAAGVTNNDIPAAQAATDGEFICMCEWTGADLDQEAYARGLSDSANPPTTELGFASITWSFNRVKYASYSFLVKKGDYYKADWIGLSADNAPVTRKYYFLAIGT